MKRRLVIFMVTCMVVTVAWSQKTCVIASAEDHVPIREALIHTDNNHWTRTDYRGYWTMKYQFDSATVSKPGYLKATIYLKELPDTVFLLPEAVQIGTVEVWGKNQQQAHAMSEQAKEAAREAAPPKTGISLDVANMLDKRGRRDRRHLKKARQVMGEMDKKENHSSVDEIVDNTAAGK